MRKLIMTIALILMGIIGVSAQDMFVGARYMRINPDIRQPHFRFDRDTDSIGGVASVTGYETKNIGLTAEGSATFNGSRQANQFYTALGGVTLKSRYSTSVQPYVSGLAGIGVLRVSDNQFGPSRTDTSAAYKAAVGLDLGKGKVKYRLLEVGYLRTNVFNTVQNSLVLSTGILFE